MTELVFVPLGGVGEIGMNFALYGYGPKERRQWLIVDCGVTFPGPDLPGVDLVLPDIRFIEAERKNLAGIVITHAHEDHYGALLALYEKLSPDGAMPVHMTPFGAGMLEAKAQGEHGAPKIPVEIYDGGQRFTIGPFEIEAIAVTHSIPEPVSLAIRTPAGMVLHTGDWKNDTDPALGPLTDEPRFRALGDEGLLALVCDSTNAMREGESPSERQVSEGLAEVITNASGRVAVTTFSSNVGRIKSIAEAAQTAGRRVLLMGRSMKRVVDVATDLGYMEGLDPFLGEDEFGHIPRNQVVIILTGSQGEPRAALAKLGRDEMRDVKLTAGDTVVYSSRTIPGNEKAILETKNRLIDMGIEVIEDTDALVHVSGHPRRNELRQMYKWTRPKIGVPVHGEAAHLAAHAKLMREEGIADVMDARNGDMVRLAPGAPEIIDDVPHGQIFKDGKIIGDDDAVGVNDRRRLSFAGHVSVSVILDRKQEIAAEPQVVAIGLPRADAHGEDLEDILFEAVVGAVESMPRGRRKDLDAVEDAVGRAVRAAARNAWGKKPLVTVLVDRV
ncbi:ribonuclease J [Oceaniradius stylonematis]|uniref:Ribonuclease J n=1 Tax=Oceaniradius stylonematis TaxID=2184161 RepID=A0A3A8A8U1_9HYPH|nr:ribonuclease J [Oceaniradius stylonematis]RKF06345.1 ribonuclease J [Oceaniradius stylonematis]